MNRPWIAFFSQTGSEIVEDTNTILHNIHKFKWFTNGSKI